MSTTAVISKDPLLLDPVKKAERLERFKDHLLTPSTSSTTHASHLQSLPPTSPRVKGTSKKLEKPYLRLTSSPNPSTIRPVSVLKLSLDHIIDKYCDTNDYDYVCEQFKSIRQDLTVQNIQSRFTAHVYELHARLALHHDDLNEFQQCQSRLLELKALGVPISSDEFNCYNILYNLYQKNFVELMQNLKILFSSPLDYPLEVKNILLLLMDILTCEISVGFCD